MRTNQARHQDGKWKAEERQTVDLDLASPSPTLEAFIERDQTVGALVADAIESGLLRTASPAGTEPRWETPEVVVGQTVDGRRVTFKMAFARRGPGTTVDHDASPGVWEVSAQVWFYKGRWIQNGGAINGVSLGDAVKFAPGVTRETADAMQDIASEHGNALNAGCSHQGRPTIASLGRLDRDSVPPCPHTGYRWGSAWLQRAADPDKVAAALQAVGASRKHEPVR